PARAGRLWLAMAVAHLWVIAVGGEAEAREEALKSKQSPANGEEAKAEENRPHRREESCFLRGRLLILAAAVRAEPLPLGRFVPAAWPTKLSPVLKASSAWARRQREKQQTRKQKRRRNARVRARTRRQK